MTSIVLPIDFAEPLVHRHTPSVLSLYLGGLVYAIREKTNGFLPAASSIDLARVPSPEKAAAQACAARLFEETPDGYRIPDFDQRTEAWLRTAIAAEGRSRRSKRAADRRWNKEAQMSLQDGGLAIVELGDPEHAPSICSPPYNPPREEQATKSTGSSRKKRRKTQTSPRDRGPGEGSRHPTDTYVDELRRRGAKGRPS